MWDMPSERIMALFGLNEEKLSIYSQVLPAHIGVRGNTISVRGTQQQREATYKAIRAVDALVRPGITLENQEITQTLRSSINRQESEYTSAVNILYKRGKYIRAKTPGQKRYVNAIDTHTITCGIGPAGTGKTFLAIATAVRALEQHSVRRIILTRPVVEAGENLGFLPGSLQEKIDPYLRPLFDALGDLLDPDVLEKLISHEVIEIAPLAYMRGRTLNEAIIILDEAQNTTPEQMKMFLTRLGVGSKMIITGDITQIDRKGSTCGLVDARRHIEHLNDVEFIDFAAEDIVRHSLVSQIIGAYDGVSFSS